MNILITGAGGFIGKAFILKNKKHKIFALYNSSDYQQNNNNFFLNLHYKEHIIKLVYALKDSKVDIIIHLAGHTPFYKKNINSNFSKELIMTENICLLCKKLHILKLFYSSGWTIYGSNSSTPYKENSILQPDTEYGKSKLEVENYLKNNLKNTRCINLRLTSIYGPGQISNGLIPNSIQSALYQKKIYIDNCNIKRNYLYIDDLTKIINKLITLKITHSFDLNIAHNKSYKLIEVAKKIHNIFNKKLRQTVKIITSKKNLDSFINIDNQLNIQLFMNYFPNYKFTSLQVGINSYINWVLKNTYIVFDLDGTIINVFKRWYDIHRDLSTKYDFRPLSINQYLQMKKNKIDEKKIISHTNINQINISKYLNERILLLESRKYLFTDKLKPGVINILKLLSKSYKLILLTNRNNIPFLYEQLKLLQINYLFKSVIISNKNNKYDILKKYWSTKNILFKYIIGDTETDFELSEKFGIQSILLADGCRSTTYLKRFKKAIVLNSIKDLSKIVIIDHAKTLLYSSNR
jgi:UDP-glucose 4-epimerase